MVTLPEPFNTEFVFLVCLVFGTVFYMWALYVIGKHSTTELSPQPQMLPLIRILALISHVLMLQRLMHVVLPPGIPVLSMILSTEHE